MPKKTAEKGRLQVGALPLKFVGDQLLVLLVTSRETGKWVIPKGWPMRGRDLSQAAEIEAREEAGVEGRIRQAPIGSYRYWKRRTSSFELCRVKVFPLHVASQLENWKEQGQRQLAWLDPMTAAETALEPELSSLIARAAADEKTLAFLRKGFGKTMTIAAT